MTARHYQESSRIVAIGLMTSQEALHAADIKLLQTSLNISPNGALDSGTRKAIANFLAEPQNSIYSQSLSPQLQESMTRDRTSNLFAIRREIGNPHIEGVLSYPGAFDDHHIKRLQTALYIQNPDGRYGHDTQDRLVDYLSANPEAWTIISPAMLRLMLSNTEGASKIRSSLAENRPPEYTDRVRDLIAATNNVHGINPQTHELQLLLSAGDFYPDKNADGIFGHHTQRAVAIFEKEYKGRIPQTDVEPFDPRQTADSDPFTPTTVPISGTYHIRIGQIA